ncbi:hypothetical protein [Heyndrickxia acidiproducens]|uniref:hypothetical protein n=1 Tax=Heyndrickxia acidiproducens TaxID=1121084 RepID=UPI00037E0CC6|nr:hypothetical protein [Heyndrickxia acidiproducens]
MAHKKWLIAIAVFIASFMAFMPMQSFAAVSVQSDINTTADYYKAGELTDGLVVAALAKENKLTANEKKTYRNYLSNQIKTTTLGAADLDKAIIALKAIGEDPENFAGKNLVEMVYRSSESKTTTGYAYDLIALNTGDYTIPDDAVNSPKAIVDKLTSLEYHDGGWSWGTGATSSDVDSTGMVLTALATYQDQHDGDVKAAIRYGIRYLKAAEKDNAGFDNYGINSNSTAQAIIGLTSAGVDPTAGDFVKKGTNPVSLLSTFKDKKNGGYKWQTTSEASDSFSTAQVFQALVAYNQFVKGSSLYDFSTVSSSNSAGSTDTSDNNSGSTVSDISSDSGSGTSTSSDSGSTKSTTGSGGKSGAGTTTSGTASDPVTKVIERSTATKEIISNNHTVTNDHTVTNNDTTTNNRTITEKQPEQPATAHAKTTTAKDGKNTAPVPAITVVQDNTQPAKVVITKTTDINPLHGWVGFSSVLAGGILIALRKTILGRWG